MLLQLKILNGVRQGEILSVEKFPACFGRGEEADFYIKVEDMSRKHFVILEEQKRFYLVDCNSTNGTYLNEHKVSEKTPLKNEDYIQSGSFLCQVFIQEPQFKENQEVHESKTPPLSDASDSKIRRKIPQNILEQLSAQNSYNALKILYEVLQQCNEESDYEALLNKLLEKMFFILKAERGVIVLNYKNLKFDAFINLRGKGHPFPLSKTILTDVLQNGVSICSADLHEDARYLSSESLRIQKVQSLVCVPILSADEILGAIYFDRCSRSAPSFKDADLELLAAIGIVSGNTLQKLLLYQKIHKINSHLMTILENFSGGKNKLEIKGIYGEQCSEMEDALYSISQGITAVTGEDFLRFISNFLIQNLEVDYVHIGILDKNSGVITTKIAQKKDKILDNFEYPINGTPCEKVIQEQKIFYSEHSHQKFSSPDYLINEVFQSYLGVPLFFLDGSILGVMMLLSKQPFKNLKIAEMMLQIFAFRVASEIERKSSEISMQNLNKKLQKRAEELFISQKLLEKQTKNLQTILDSIGDGVVVISNQYDFLLCNPAAENMMEIDRSEKLCERWLEKANFLLPDKKTVFPFRQFPLIIAVQGESVKKVEAFLSSDYSVSDGVWLSINARPIKDADNNIRGAVAVFSDITEKKQQEEFMKGMQSILEKKVQERTAALRDANESLKKEILEKTQTQEALKQSNLSLEHAMAKLKETQEKLINEERLRALGQMASGIVHDFNNALGPITGFSELLLNRPENLQNTQKVKKYLELIHIASKDASRVVERLSNFYRKREKTENRIAINMNVLLQQVASLTEPKWKEQPRAKGITIEMEMNFQTIPLVMGNEADLREALTNVIFNSVDAMEKNGKIILCTELNHPYVTIKIYDTGKGMTKEIKQRCLEPFYSTKGKEGTGLGLSMVFGIVQRHEGHLEIISEENKGTCIVINLPFVAENKVEKKPEESKEIKIRPLKILVAEDDPNVREVISLYLEEEGHKSVITSDGLEALQKFPTEPFDLVITDQAMPNMSGDQLAKKIKYISPEMPIILLTGFTSFLNSDNIASYGIDFVMHKPLNRNKLQQALSKFFLAKEIS